MRNDGPFLIYPVKSLAAGVRRPHAGPAIRLPQRTSCLPSLSMLRHTFEDHWVGATVLASRCAASILAPRSCSDA